MGNGGWALLGWRKRWGLRSDNTSSSFWFSSVSPPTSWHRWELSLNTHFRAPQKAALGELLVVALKEREEEIMKKKEEQEGEEESEKKKGRRHKGIVVQKRRMGHVR